MTALTLVGFSGNVKMTERSECTKAGVLYVSTYVDKGGTEGEDIWKTKKKDIEGGDQKTKQKTALESILDFL